MTAPSLKPGAVVTVTGSGGFIGRHLLPALQCDGWQLRAASRGPLVPGAAPAELQPQTPSAALVEALAGSDALVHLAGLAHDRAGGADARALERINADWTLRLFEACRSAGVSRMIWLSSIKVLGDVAAEPLPEDAPHAPADDYARSKAAGERRLLAAHDGATALTIVRPPLVYGPGVAGNLRLLLRGLDSGVPLPLGRAVARRSLLGVTSLVEALLHLLRRPSEGEARILHLADDDDLRVVDLLESLAAGLGRSPRLLAVPPAAVRAGAWLLGRSGVYERLFEPLRVDQRNSRAWLGWSPSVSQAQQLTETAQWYSRHR